MTGIVLSYRYRLLPNKAQYRALAEICESQRHLYNAALAERIDCYRKTGSGLSYFRQAMELRECRRDLPEMAALPANIQRGTLKRLDRAFNAFFRRVKRGDEPGFPRFRNAAAFTSFAFAEFSGVTFDGKRLHFKGLPGGLRVHLHRQLPEGKICTANFRRDRRGWSVTFNVKAVAVEKVAIGTAVGIDVGLKALAYLSDGTSIPNIRPAQKAERAMRRSQRALARCRRGSTRRSKIRKAVAASHETIANIRRTYLHQQSAWLVKAYDLIAVEDLNVAGLARSMFAKAIHDVSWTAFIDMIAYKAERAGKHFVKVDAKNTTQGCSSCGVIVPKTLAVRMHDCPHCGLVLDRDENAARNVLRKGVLALEALNVAQWGERAPGNIKGAIQ